MDQHKFVIRKLSLKMRNNVCLLIFLLGVFSITEGCAALKSEKKEPTPASPCEKPELNSETNSAPCTPDLDTVTEPSVSSKTTVSVYGSQEAPAGSVSEEKTISPVSQSSSSSSSSAGSANTQEPAQSASSDSQGSVSAPAPSATSGTETIKYPSSSYPEIQQGEVPEECNDISNAKTPQNQDSNDFINVSDEKSADSSSKNQKYQTIYEGQ